MSIASNIKRLRESHGLTQAQFGAIAGVTDKAVSTWEAGIKEPRMGSVQKICDYFGISKSEILLDEQDLLLLSDSKNKSRPNTIRIAGRDGSFVERQLTDEQLALFQSMLDQMKPIDDETLSTAETVHTPAAPAARPETCPAGAVPPCALRGSPPPGD